MINSWADLPGDVRWSLQNRGGHCFGSTHLTRAAAIDYWTGLHAHGHYANKTRRQKWRYLRDQHGVRVVRVKIVPEIRA